MRYVEGFVAAVPTAEEEAYRRHAAEAEKLLREFGVARMVETWGDAVPDGKVTDFRRAVQAEPGETVVFSWFEYPSRDLRDAANRRIFADPRMKEMDAATPFDGRRMIYGGFAPFLDLGPGGVLGYADGFLLAVPEAKRAAYEAMAAALAPVFVEQGATRKVEAWGDAVPEGEFTDFRRAVKAEPGEVVVFSWTEWPDKATREAGWEKALADPRMEPYRRQMPFDGKRVVYGGFRPILDSAAAVPA